MSSVFTLPNLERSDVTGMKACKREANKKSRGFTMPFWRYGDGARTPQNKGKKRDANETKISCLLRRVP